MTIECFGVERRMSEKWNHFNDRKKQYGIIAIIGIVFMLSITLVFLIYSDKKVVEPVGNATKTTNNTTTVPTSTEEPTTTMDFSEFKDINSEVFAYINIPGTNIDYPIIYDEDEYYLNRTIEGEYDYHGTLFVQHYNTNTFEDRNTLIYGHNLIDNTMFSQLHKYEDKEFFDEYNEINIYMEGKNLKYTIFAAFQFTDVHIMYQYKFENNEQMQDFLSEAKDIGTQMIWDESVEIKEDDCIITLSTCANGNQPKNRWLVLAVLNK